MKIAILGAGSVGGTLGRGWAKSHQVFFGVRHPNDESMMNRASSITGELKTWNVLTD